MASRLGDRAAMRDFFWQGDAARGTTSASALAAIGTVSNVASRCDEAKPGQILISPRVLMAVEDTVIVEPVGEFSLKGIRRPLAAYNVLPQAG